MILLLIHSPLLGRSSWMPVSEGAASMGVPSVVPDLSGCFAADSDWSSGVADEAARLCPTGADVLVVGHSGAGYYLPKVGEAIGMDRTSFAFVDAVLPPRAGTLVPGEAIASLLDSHTHDGLLEPWLDWWPPSVVDQALPNPADQAAVRRDMPRVQRAIYEEAVSVPVGWHSRPIQYVQTSAAYEAEAQQASALGWQVQTIDGSHLSIVTDPGAVLDLIVG